jgi:hypothetical protein
MRVASYGCFGSTLCVNYSGFDNMFGVCLRVVLIMHCGEFESYLTAYYGGLEGCFG